MDKEEQARLYVEQMGSEALDRQKDLAASLCNECGVGGKHHHPACRRGRRLAAAKEKRDRERNSR